MLVILAIPGMAVMLTMLVILAIPGMAVVMLKC